MTRTTRAALLLAATALTPALLLSTPASAAVQAAKVSATASTPVNQMSDDDVRVAIVRILADPASGKAVLREANKALDGTIADQRAFLETGYRLAQAEDDRVAIVRILADPKSGKAVKREANKALDGTIADQRAFLETGYRLAQGEDDRVAALRILADPKSSPALRAAASAALDGTLEQLRYFIAVGQYQVH
ncbi:ALF repeat-containing protein [Streptomyces sp. NPDC090119]|uniref:ALF repeat-containing protein n=1 Tax=Streptomyces sp. NPDC090119 TaxID=3365951 RepID=UPI0037F21E7B